MSKTCAPSEVAIRAAVSPPRATADDSQVIQVVCHVCSSEGTRFLPSIPTSSIALKGREFCSLDYIARGVEAYVMK
jgi:hypothetical protein